MVLKDNVYYKSQSFYENITFKTKSFRKNYDFVSENDSFVQEFLGEITVLQIEEDLPPKLIGDFYITVWDFGLARLFGLDLRNQILENKGIIAFDDIVEMTENNDINFNKVNKIIYVNNFIIKEEYRKKKISEEFTEFLFKTYHGPQNIILVLAKPIQTVLDDYNYYMTEKNVEYKYSYNGPKNIENAGTYYKLQNFENFHDEELNNYKLFALASRCGFKRIGETNLFSLKPKKIINRIKKKLQLLKQLQ